MSYSVDLQFTINEDFSNPQTISESGQPSAMTLQGLQASQTYYTKAVLKNDGVVEDESQMTSFQTLPAGTIVLNHYQTTRSGYAYDVTYLYSSTYAPSWCTLSVNGSTFQGVFNSAQHAVSFLVTGLTPGTAYLDLVTLGDIYGETGSVQGSIVTTVVNDIDITSVETEYTTADVNIDYIVDGGFYVGYVEWWLYTQDPAQDQPQGHEYFNNGAETVTISNLSSGTEYKFRASITLNDQVTTINSNVVAAETEITYAQRYFTIENTSGQNNTISIETNNSNGAAQVSISTDDGTTWSSVTSSVGGTTMATLNSGERLLIKHVGALGGMSGFTALYNRIKSTGNFIVYGNVSSLTNGDAFITTSDMPQYGLWHLFLENQFLTSAENLYFGSYQSAGMSSCQNMFNGCTSLVSVPSVLQPTTINLGCYLGMFKGCTSLTTSPTLPATTINAYCYQEMFQDCTSLISAPQLSATTLYSGCYASMFQGCTSLTSAPTLSATTLAPSCYASMFQGCTSLTSAPTLSATALANNCYASMFNDCTALENAPQLPATNLMSYCYQYMFSGCVSLSTPPKLAHVRDIGSRSLQYMFYNCEHIEEIYAPNVSSWNEINSLNWLRGVAAEGVVYKPAELEIPTDTPDGVPVGWTTQDYQ